MSLTLQLNPELEKLSIEQAQANKMSLEAYLELAIEKQLSGDNQNSSLEKSYNSNWNNLLDRLGESPSLASAALLSDDAISRKNIYHDREQKQ